MDRMTGAKTMRAILAVVQDFSGAAAATPTAPELTVAVAAKTKAEINGSANGKLHHQAEESLAASLDTDCPRCLAAVIACSLSPGNDEQLRSGVILVTDDGHGIAAGVVRELQGAGGRAALIGNNALANRKAAEKVTATVRKAKSVPIVGVIRCAAPLANAPVYPNSRSPNGTNWLTSKSRDCSTCCKH